jgi:hypothetical protein
MAKPGPTQSPLRCPRWLSEHTSREQDRESAKAGIESVKKNAPSASVEEK